LDDQAKAILQFTDAVDSLTPVTDALAPVAQFLGPDEVAELTLSVGFWSMVARFLVALQIELEPGTPGFDGWQKG
jgi:alkylhydroperoxidase family enzyme